MKQTQSATRVDSHRGLNLQAILTAGPVRSWPAAVAPPVDRLPVVLSQEQQQAVPVRLEKPADLNSHLRTAAA